MREIADFEENFTWEERARIRSSPLFHPYRKERARVSALAVKLLRSTGGLTDPELLKRVARLQDMGEALVRSALED